jgi:hypothetical protein
MTRAKTLIMNSLQTLTASKSETVWKRNSHCSFDGYVGFGQYMLANSCEVCIFNNRTTFYYVF